ncbi:MAG: hypothetical protein J0H99_22055, partial [Rhodospirillales bacterium]|nr:hypothetical protein [Rhodospirillales bacterium]
ICFAVGPGDPDWHIKPSKMHVETHYRWEIENLADLSHLTWVHEKTVGGDPAYGQIKPTHTLTPRGVNTLFWVRSVAPTGIVAHLFPPDMKLDICFDIQHTVPCNWVMRFRAFSERAIRAVLDSRCATLPLPREMLGQTRTWDFRFRP